VTLGTIGGIWTKAHRSRPMCSTRPSFTGTRQRAIEWFGLALARVLVCFRCAAFRGPDARSKMEMHSPISRMQRFSVFVASHRLRSRRAWRPPLLKGEGAGVREDLGSIHCCGQAVCRIIQPSAAASALCPAQGASASRSSCSRRNGGFKEAERVPGHLVHECGGREQVAALSSGYHSRGDAPPGSTCQQD
jgi:hypothetical protein